MITCYYYQVLGKLLLSDAPKASLGHLHHPIMWSIIVGQCHHPVLRVAVSMSVSTYLDPHHPTPGPMSIDVVVSETIVLPVATLFMDMTFLQANLQSPALVLSEFWDLFSLSAPLPAANYYGYRARWYQSPRLAQIWFWNLPPTFLNCSTARICRWLEIQCRIPLPNPVVYTFWGPRIADEILWRHNFISSH